MPPRARGPNDRLIKPAISAPHCRRPNSKCARTYGRHTGTKRPWVQEQNALGSRNNGEICLQIFFGSAQFPKQLPSFCLRHPAGSNFSGSFSLKNLLSGVYKSFSLAKIIFYFSRYLILLFTSLHSSASSGGSFCSVILGHSMHSSAFNSINGI